ncbi:hypothetical protein [Micromonospora haikouensis]|uniref:hypothetical protein n=1 Tax=Micromonospora haikouensis TaxID=686309 RepID=UPI003D7165EA
MPRSVADLIAELEAAVEDYEQAAADPAGEANEAAQAVAEACLALRNARGWIARKR